MINTLISFGFLIIGLCDFSDPYEDVNAKKELDRLTRLLCEAGKVFRKEKSASSELLKWWKDHFDKDKKLGRD